MGRRVDIIITKRLRVVHYQYLGDGACITILILQDVRRQTNLSQHGVHYQTPLTMLCTRTVRAGVLNVESLSQYFIVRIAVIILIVAADLRR